ncbi:MAG: T9SS type A sorting domain-containing protein [Armatimonadetes bacterium]|nr:T9SS type A sorting domain-containing protein [Armatimonadota bacterium]
MKKFLFLIILTIVFSLLYPQDFNFISQFQGICYSAENRGDYAYFNSGGNIHILDISNPNNISIINEIHIGKKMCSDIHINNDLMFLGTSGCVLIYSIENQIQPEIIGQIEHNAGFVNKLFSVDSLLIAIKIEKAFFYDVTDLTNIQFLSSISFDCDENAYCINNNVIYGFIQCGFSGPHYLVGYDFSYPENPELVAELYLGEIGTPWPDFFYSYNDLIFSVVNDSIKIYDISIQSEINFITSFSIDDNVLSFNIDNDVMYVSTENESLIMIDISDILNPEILGSFDWNAEISDIFIDSNLVLLSAEAEGFKIIDITDFTNIDELFHYNDTRAVGAIKIQDNIAFVDTYNNGLHIIDISNIEEHVILGQIGLTYIDLIELYDSHLYCFSDYDSLIHIVDVSDPCIPQEVGEININNPITDFCIEGEYLFLIENNNGIHIYDLIEPETPSEIAFEAVDGYELDVYENFLFLADNSDEFPYTTYLKLYNIENLNNFQFLSELILGDGSDYSIREIMLNIPETPDLFVGFNKGVASCSINSSNQLELCHEYILTSGLFSEFYFDGQYIYCGNPYGSTYVFNSNINIGVISTIPGYAKSYGKHQNILFVTSSFAGYSLFSTPFTNIIEDVIEYENSFELKQNHPNPFNPTTTISFSLQNNSNVELSIYNIKGQKVKKLVSDQLSAGQHSVVWDGKDEDNFPVGSGVYFYKLKAGDKILITKKCLLLK